MILLHRTEPTMNRLLLYLQSSIRAYFQCFRSADLISVRNTDFPSGHKIMFYIFLWKSQFSGFLKQGIYNLCGQSAAVKLSAASRFSYIPPAIPFNESGYPSAASKIFNPIPTTANSIFPLSKSVTASVRMPQTFFHYDKGH